MYNILTTGPFGPINTGVPAAVMTIGVIGDFKLIAGISLVIMAIAYTFVLLRNKRQRARSFS
ncbi:hypothetical protein [Ferrimicrobium acidiphilum]|jgi:hypothetical protein|uniref:hypothetical protein n=1 Tax=Ferrimicrobium acidiphilum TaxID=121039 RepID=UPI0023F19615|nr:hypothetical protein [Ferrimicrobium acidiphilum]